MAQTAPQRTPSWLDQAAWPFAPHAVQVDDGLLHYVDEGQGDVIVLVHGTPSWSFDWRHVIHGLRDSYRVIAIDHLGFGLSERPVGAGYRPEDHARRWRQALDRLGLGPVHVVVHDFGGPIALDTVLDQPERFKSLTVINSWMWSFEDDADMRRKAWVAGSWLGRLLYRYANASLKIIAPSAWGDRSKLTPAIQSQLLAPFASGDARVTVLWALAYAMLASSAFYRSLWDRRSVLGGLRCLVVWGVADSAFQPRQLARWRTVLPHATVVALERSGHWPHEEEPTQVIAALRAHLAA